MTALLHPRGSPDGIGWQGVYFDHHQNGGMCIAWYSRRSGRLMCEKHRCVNPKTGSPGTTYPRRRKGSGQYTHMCKKPGISPFKGVCDEQGYCDKSGAPQVCQKQQVLHMNHMSRSAGVLVLKRSSCLNGECAVFKSGLCIDLRKNVWSSTINGESFLVSISHICNNKPNGISEGGMITQAKEFGRQAAALLKKHNNTLPAEYRCSDHRHTGMITRRGAAQE